MVIGGDGIEFESQHQMDNFLLLFVVNFVLFEKTEIKQREVGNDL